MGVATRNPGRPNAPFGACWRWMHGVRRESESAHESRRRRAKTAHVSLWRLRGHGASRRDPSSSASNGSLRFASWLSLGGPPVVVVVLRCFGAVLLACLLFAGLAFLL